MSASMRLATSLAVMFSLALLASATHAAWPHDPNNGNLPLCTAANDQQSPTIVSDGAGGVIVTWQDLRSFTSTDIYAQRVNAAGVPQWAGDGVALCTASNVQYSPTIVSDGAGGAIVTWQDYRTGNYDIYAQRVNAAGVPQWTGNGVALSTAVGNQQSPTIAPDGAGGAIITWQDYRNSNADIYTQRVNAAGAPQWTSDGVALSTTASNQTSPTITPDGAGGAIITWQDYRNGASDIFAQRVNAAGVPYWTSEGAPVSTAPGYQLYPMIVSDGAGGAIITWQDGRGTNYDIYEQRLNATGVPQWTGNGVALATGTGDQQYPTIVSDGAGGSIVTWQDNRSGTTNDIYAQRANAGGVPQWTGNGVALATAAGDQQYPAIASDGAGGAIVTWYDSRAGTNYDIYAQRVNGAGAPLWTVNGVALSTAANGQVSATIASDGAGGAVVTWQDYRSGTNNDIYAQRIERFGQLGNPEPVSAGIRDVPNDQGGKVGIHWTASYLDVAPNNPIDSYWIWRQVPTSSAERALKQGQSLFGPRTAGSAPRPGVLRRTIEGAQVYYWEFVGSQVSHGFPGYSYTATTFSDSVAASNPYTKFMIEAEDTYMGFYWGSVPDSGYSVDNLPPVAPAPFTGAYLAGATGLHWGENRESDLAGYRVYRGSSPGFIPSPGNLIAAKPDTGWSDVGAAGSYYKLSAVDVHGNESPFDLLGPGSTTDVGGTPLPHVLAFAAPRPNPARGQTLLSFALPKRGPVTLAVYDMEGRRRRTLNSGGMDPGEYQVAFDLRDGEGRQIPCGLYFMRLEANGQTLVRRLAIVK